MSPTTRARCSRWEPTLDYARDDSFRAVADHVLWGLHRRPGTNTWVVTKIAADRERIRDAMRRLRAYEFVFVDVAKERMQIVRAPG
jgi:hypothetical protein